MDVQIFWTGVKYYFALCIVPILISAGSLNQGAATASSEPILKAAHLIAIFNP